MKTLRVIAALFYVAIFAVVMPTSPASAVIAPQPCDQVSWAGEDDSAHLMALPYSLPLGNTTYDTTYVTTNGTLTFGAPDANFSSYPTTPSISLAGYDWVTWSGGHLSYGVTDTGFCVEWMVRPYPQSSGDFTTIKLTVDTSRLPIWSGIVETTGWLPTDLRRGIRFQSNEAVVQISEAFTINGGLPVEMQTCWDNSIIPMTSTCPVEPPPGQCWDGSTVPWNGTCPPIPPDTQCWDGSWVTWSQTCPIEPQPITCWDGSVIPYNQTCPATPPDIVCWDGSTVPWSGTCAPEPPPIQCWDGTSVPWNGTCPIEPQVVCWDNSVVHYQSECAPTPPDITCWNGEVVPWNGSCQQVPPPIECWDGTSVNWDQQCPLTPPDIVCWDGSVIPWNGTCAPEPPSITCWDGSIIAWDQICLIEPTPTPTPQPKETVTPTPTPEPTQSLQPVLVPIPEPSPTPLETSTTEPTPTPEPIIEPVQEVINNASADGVITTAETQAIIDNLLSDGNLSTSEVTDLLDNLQSDGQLSQEERDFISDVLVAAYEDTAIPADVFEASGLDYENLPPEQPITLDNGVVITAEIADAIEIFENPSELLSTVFTNPSKALKAVANVGADMTAATRKEAQTVTVAAVIVSQVIAGTSALTLARK
jgi:hypothetical protein